MTREDAILHMTLRREELKHSVGDLDEDIKAFDMAIEALEQEPVLDKIRAEIAEEQNDCMVKEQIDTAYGLELALGIIDKYKEEREE